MIRNSLRSACALAALAAPLLSQSTIRLTAGLAGAEPDGLSSEPQMSGDGRFVVYTSLANNLTPDDTSAASDIFLHDLVLGTRELISVRIPGMLAPGECGGPVVSDDGNWVAYWSTATNLVAGGTATADIYVRDRAAATTTCITTGWAGNSTAPTITPDGRYLAFQSLADNVVAGGMFEDVFRYDRQTNTFVLISQSTAGVAGNMESLAPRISADGNQVTFLTASSNFLLQDTNGVVDVYLRDVAAVRTRRTSVNWLGNELTSASSTASMTRDGGMLCFVNAEAAASSGDSDVNDDVLVRTLQGGFLTRVSTPASGKGGNGISNDGVIAGNGRYVAFRSNGTDLVPADPTPGAADIYLKDMETRAIEVVSLSSAGAAAGDPSSPALSLDGRFIAFATTTGLVSGDANGLTEIYVRDRGVIVFTTPCAGDGSSTPCPCGNPGYPGNGCENYGLTGGVRLAATGNPSLSGDTLHLALTGFSALTTPLAYFQGDGLLNGGLGVAFGDGVHCVGGNTIRFARRNSVNGMSEYGAGVPSDTAVSIAGHVDVPGSTRYYQATYFNFGSFCGQLRRNWSNSIAVVWAP